MEYRYNEFIQQKIAVLEKTYSHYRHVRGDGNCFFRAAIFNYVEMLIAKPEIFAFFIQK